MRVIYLLRSAQLLLTPRALWLLYSVSHFCEKTQHSLESCSDMTANIRDATSEEIAEMLQRRAARNGVTSNASTTTAHAPATTESSTVSTTEEAKNRKKRVKREEKFVLPGNGIKTKEGQSKAAAAVETKKDEGKKEGEQKSTPEVKTEAKVDDKKEDKKEEAITTPVPAHHEDKKVEQKPDHSEVKESKVEVKKEDKKEGEQKSTPEVKTEAKVDEKKGKIEDKKPEHSSVEKKETTTVVKKEEPVHSTTEATKEPKKEKKEKKEYLGAKINIPVASDAHHHDEKPAEGKVDSAPSSSSEEKHHTVKKDLKAHVQEPTKIEEKEELPPKQPVHEGSELGPPFLENVRCVEVTWSAYLGRQSSPFAAHLKGLVFVGPVLVSVCVYLVCTVLLTILAAETPSKFAQSLGCIFHAALWVVVIMSVGTIHDHWALNWYTTGSFKPEFPCEWTALMILSSIMCLAVGLETVVQMNSKRLDYDIVFERAYRCYEVIDTDPTQDRLSRTNVY